MPAVFFGHSTIERLSQYLHKHHLAHLTHFYASPLAPEASPGSALAMPVVPAMPAVPEARLPAHPSTAPALRVDEPIAVIGLSGRFPGAPDVESFWQLLASGTDAVGEVPLSRWDWRELYGGPHAPGNQITTAAGAFLEGIEEFDPLFFNLSPREAEEMDPRQRLMLQEAWHAFEDAGYAPEYLRGSHCAVYIGVEEGEYSARVSEEALATSNHSAILAARISYQLDLRGPNLAINTACSSSLVALHQACEALRRAECELALVGGVNLMLTAAPYRVLTQWGCSPRAAPAAPLAMRRMGWCRARRWWRWC